MCLTDPVQLFWLALAQLEEEGRQIVSGTNGLLQEGHLFIGNRVNVGLLPRLPFVPSFVEAWNFHLVVLLEQLHGP